MLTTKRYMVQLQKVSVKVSVEVCTYVVETIIIAKSSFVYKPKKQGWGCCIFFVLFLRG